MGRDNEDGVVGVLCCGKRAEEAAIALDAFVFPSERFRHLLCHDGVACFLAVPRVDIRGALVVALPACQEPFDGRGVFPAVLIHETGELRIGRPVGHARLRLLSALHPAGRHVVGPGILAELAAVGLVGTEEESDTVVHARNGEGDVACVDADRAHAAETVADGDQVDGRSV